MPDAWMDVDTNVIVPANILPLLDDTDFKTIETAVVYNSAGLVITWNFVTTAGVVTAVAVTPTTGGNYDWSEPLADKGMYAMEIPASGGASANNDTEGVGWFTGVATGVLPWRGPTIGFRRKALNDLLIAGSTASTNLEYFFDGTGYAGGTAKLGVNLIQILGTTLTETAGLIAAAFKKFFNVATPTGTVNSIPDAVAGAASGIAIVGSEMAANVTKVNGAAQTATLDTIKAETAELKAAVITNAAGVDIAADIIAMKADTAAILSDTGTDGVVVAAASKTGYALSAAGVQAIWDALTSALTTVGSIGKKLADWVVGSLNADQSAVTVGTVTTATNLTNAPTAGDLTAAMKASVNAEVLDVLNVDTFAEPGQEAPAATNTLSKKIGYLFKFLRNRVTQDATTLKVYDDAGTTVDQKATVSDDLTTYDRGEIGSGP